MATTEEGERGVEDADRDIAEESSCQTIYFATHQNLSSSSMKIGSFAFFHSFFLLPFVLESSSRHVADALLAAEQ